MTPIEQFFDQLLNIQVWSVVKVFILLALALYIVFAVVVIRQVKLMNRTLKGVFNLPISLIAWLHLGLALFVFVLSFLIL
jgi:hypothetical protein